MRQYRHSPDPLSHDSPSHRVQNSIRRLLKHRTLSKLIGLNAVAKTVKDAKRQRRKVRGFCKQCGVAPVWRGVLAKDRAIRLTRVSAWVDMQTQRLQASLPSVEPPLTAEELAKQRADRIAAQRRKILCERARQRTLESQKKDMHALGVVVHKCEQKQSFPCPRSPAGAPEGFWSMLLKLHRGRGVVCLSPALAPHT